MNRTELIKYLRSLDACEDALAWVEKTPGEPEDLWAACQRGDWLIWLIAAVNYDERTLRHIACDVAEGVLPIYERAHPDDRRPRGAIAVARRYADGAATYDELIAASAAAEAADEDAAEVAASYAACAAAWAAANDAAGDAARAAAEDAAGAAVWDAAGAAARARQADMVRARVTWADVEALLVKKGAAK